VKKTAKYSGQNLNQFGGIRYYLFAQNCGWYGTYKICKGSMEAHFDQLKMLGLFLLKLMKSNQVRKPVLHQGIMGPQSCGESR
jgi:hypothetical protein